MDSALTLKHLLALMKTKVKKFNQRVGLVLDRVIGTATKLDLWQTYAHCHFDYFSPAIVISNQTRKFESLFTSSLKKALDLPLHLPNERLIRIIGVPTLTQIAGYHVKRNRQIILQRFGGCPFSLTRVFENLSESADQYIAIKKASPIVSITEGCFKVDIRALIGNSSNKSLLGLATGIYLTSRCTNSSQGPLGSVRHCTVCKVLGTQAHFLNDCPINLEPRKFLKQRIPAEFEVPLLNNGNFTAFFEQIRELDIRAKGVKVPKKHCCP